MKYRMVGGFALLFVSSVATAAPQATQFAIREAPGIKDIRPLTLAAPANPKGALQSGRRGSLVNAIAVVSPLGRVTSTTRTAAHNRRVGGVRNSFHLSGRAIDVVPRRGVRHADVEQALRRAGYHLIESLDEGDHSHFAFSWTPPRTAPQQAPERTELTAWRIVSAPERAAR